MKLKGKWPIYLCLILTIFAIIVPIFLIRYEKGRREQKARTKLLTVDVSPPDAQPIDVRVSNINPQGFTVSWISVRPGTENTTKTPLATTGKISYLKEGETTNLTALDKRGENFNGTTHYAELANLSPETNYSFKIISGPETYYFKNNQWTKTGGAGDLFLIKTLKIIGDETIPPSPENPYGAYSLEQGAFLPCPDGTANPPATPCFRPNPLLLTVGNNADVIIYLVVKNQSGTLTSSILSCLTGSTGNLLGKCLVDMANFLKLDLSNYLAYNPALDKLIVWADGGNKGKAEPSEKTIPEVIADSCVSDSLHCNTSPAGESTITLNLTPLPTSIPTPTLTLTPSATPTPSPDCDLIGDLNCDGKVNEADFSVIFQNWTD